MIHFWIAIAFFVPIVQTATAQKQLVKTIDYEESLTYYRPRVTLANDGAMAIAWESLQKYDQAERWEIAVKRFSPKGVSIDSTRLIAPTFIDDAPPSAEMRNVELDVDERGSLWVSLESYVESDTIERGTQVVIGFFDRTNRYRVVAVDERDDPMNNNPRFDMDAHHVIYFAPADGGIGVVESSGTSVDEWPRNIATLARPYLDDTGVKNWFDVAIEQNMLGTVWQECKEEAEDACRVGVQFIRTIRTDSIAGFVDPVVVNQTDMPTAFRSSISMNSHGRSIVVWIDYRNTENGEIYGQLFDAYGERVGDNFAISVPGEIIDLHEGSRPEAAMRDDGSFAVVWTAHRGKAMRARCRQYDRYGKPLSDPLLLDENLAVSTGFPDVTTNGRAYAYTWMVEHDGQISIYRKKSSALIVDIP